MHENIAQLPTEQPPITNALAQPLKQASVEDPVFYEHLFEKANIMVTQLGSRKCRVRHPNTKRQCLTLK